jgi:hypothetical protein
MFSPFFTSPRKKRQSLQKSSVVPGCADKRLLVNNTTSVRVILRLIRTCAVFDMLAFMDGFPWY